MTRLATVVAMVLAAGCSGGGPCRTDVDCSPREVCTVAAQGTGGEKRCERTCQSDFDCTLALKFGHQCRQLADDSSGPATISRRAANSNSWHATVTARGVLKTCRSPAAAQRK